MEVSKCRICSSSCLEQIDYLNIQKHPFFNERKIIFCCECGFGQIYPGIKKESLDDFYENYYRSPKSDMWIDFSTKKLNRNLVDYRSLSQLLLGRQFLKVKEAYNFLDIGAGSGSSLLSAKNILKNSNLSVIEANEEAKEYYKRGFDAISVFNDLDEFRGTADVVLVSHLLEHLDIEGVCSLLDKLGQKLEEGAIIIIEVPNINLRDEFIRQNRFNDVPHLCFFSMQSLKKLINKTKFELCFINTAGQLNIEAYSKRANELRIKGFSRQGRFNRYIKSGLKRIAGRTGLLNALTNINSCISGHKSNFYDNINFQYGGERDLIRCVLRKGSL